MNAVRIKVLRRVRALGDVFEPGMVVALPALVAADCVASTRAEPVGDADRETMRDAVRSEAARIVAAAGKAPPGSRPAPRYFGVE